MGVSFHAESGLLYAFGRGDQPGNRIYADGDGEGLFSDRRYPHQHPGDAGGISYLPMCVGCLPADKGVHGQAYLTLSTGLHRQIAPHGVQGVFFQAGDLGLGDTDDLGNLHLGFSLKKTQGDDIFFPGI